MANTAEKAASFQVTHFPTAAYLGERATVVLAGRPKSSVSVKFAGKALAPRTFKTDRLELNFTFSKAGQLELADEETTFRFRVLAPGGAEKLDLADGFLYVDGVPVILLVTHRHPPKHDRTWELVKVAGDLLGMGNQPVVDRTVVLGGNYLRGAFNSPNWRRRPLAAMDLELPGMVVAVQTMKPAPLLILAPSAADLQRGMTPVNYRMRLEWLLQHVDRAKFPQLVVVWPPLSDRTRGRYPELPRFLRLATAGNDVPLLAPGKVIAQGAVPATDWRIAVEKRLHKWVTFRE